MNTRNLIIIASSLLLASCKYLPVNTQNDEEIAITDTAETVCSSDSLASVLTNAISGSYTKRNPLDPSQKTGFLLRSDGSATTINASSITYTKWTLASDTCIYLHSIVKSNINGDRESVDTVHFDNMRNITKAYVSYTREVYERE